MTVTDAPAAAPARRRGPGLALAAVGYVVALVAAGLFALGQWSEPVRACTGPDAHDYGCHEQRYLDIARRDGTAAAFAAMRADHRTSDLVRSSCHPLVHALGRAAGTRLGDVRAAFAEGDRFCTAGYFHGVMETIVAARGHERALAELATYCEPIRRTAPGSINHFDCAHGLGHGLMVLTGNELFAALVDCDRLPDTWEREMCGNGVFMQNILSGAPLSGSEALQEHGHGHGLAPTAYLRPDDPFYPCAEVAEHYRKHCYSRQIGYTLSLTNNDFSAAFPRCAQIDPRYHATCHFSLGVSAHTYAAFSRPGAQAQALATAQLCDLAVGPGRAACAKGAATSFVYQADGAAELARFCAAMPADLREPCTASGRSTDDRIVDDLGYP